MFTNPKNRSGQLARGAVREPVRRARVPVLFIVSLLLLSSCTSTDRSTERLATENEIDQVVTQQQEHKSTAKAVPPEVNKALLNNQTLASGGLAKTNYEHFDVSVSNVPAKAFFLGLVNGTGVNVVVHPEVSGTVTLDLKN